MHHEAEFQTEADAMTEPATWSGQMPGTMAESSMTLSI